MPDVNAASDAQTSCKTQLIISCGGCAGCTLFWSKTAEWLPAPSSIVCTLLCFSLINMIMRPVNPPPAFVDSGPTQPLCWTLMSRGTNFHMSHRHTHSHWSPYHNCSLYLVLETGRHWCGPERASPPGGTDPYSNPPIANMPCTLFDC